MKSSQENGHLQATPVRLPVRLLCLPYAGGGASFFKAWQRIDGSVVDFVGIQMPGRENLLRQAPATTVAAAVDAVLPTVTEELARPGPVGLFGHSSGAIVAFELARRLDLQAPGRVSRLFVSGAAAPWIGRPGRATGLPDDEFIAAVQDFAGEAHPALAEPSLRSVLLPPLRADVQMHEEYRVLPGTTVDIPITVIRGADDVLISVTAAEQWSRATRSDFQYVEMPGTHMYLADQRTRMIDLVATALRGDGRDRVDEL